MALHSIELCAGVGMLGEGVRAAFEFLGFDHRTVCYVEREASAAGQLVALMEAGALDAAPIWSDLLTFDGAAWRGRVHCVIAGFPCQDLSVAGKRAGLDGKRSGLFFTVLDITDACGAVCLVLENVSGIASATASVVDETEGELDERAAAHSKIRNDRNYQQTRRRYADCTSRSFARPDRRRGRLRRVPHIQGSRNHMEERSS